MLNFEILLSPKELCLTSDKLDLVNSVFNYTSDKKTKAMLNNPHSITANPQRDTANTANIFTTFPPISTGIPNNYTDSIVDLIIATRSSSTK